MLGIDLINFRRRNGVFTPVFLDPGTSENLEYAELLTGIFSDGVSRGLTRWEMEEAISMAGDGGLSPASAGGLKKVLADRSEFVLPEEFDFPAMREKEFAATASRLEEAGGDFEKYSRLLPELEQTLYGDLPDFEKLVKTPFASGRQLIERYNLTLVQSMLFFASALTVELPSGAAADAGELRRIFKYLKFFRLMAEITALPDGGRKLEISGPAAIFGGGRKYALQLASFFPAVVRAKRWKMEAELEIRGRKGRLKLDEKSNLVSHYRSFSAYVPEEIRMFHRLFEEKVPDWRIVAGGELRNPATGEIFFPDLSFERIKDNLTFHLELFHRYHAGALFRRLEQAGELEKLNLIIGIDRSLADEAQLGKILSGAGEEWREKIFLFRDFPGVERVKSILKKAAEKFEKIPAVK